MATAYKILVNLSMSSNAPQVLGTLGRAFGVLHGQISKTEAGLSKLKVALGAAFAIGGGMMALRGIKDLVSAGLDLQQQQTKMREAGFDQAQIAQATAGAWKIAHDSIARGVTQNLELVQGLSNMLGQFEGQSRSVADAVKLAPAAAGYEVVLKSLGENAAGAGADFSRYLQLSGRMFDKDTGQLRPQSAIEREYAVGEAMAAATHGHGTTVTAKMLRQFGLQAGVGAQALTEQGFLAVAPLLATMQGASSQGSRVGTGFYQMYSELIGGRMNKATALQLEKLGILDPSKVHLHGRGRAAAFSVSPGALAQEELFKQNRMEWIWSVLGKALEKAGAHGPEAKAEAAAALSLNASVVRVLVESLRNETQLRNELRAENTALGTDQPKVAGEGGITRLQDFTNAWDNLMTALGSPLANDSTGSLGYLTDVLKYLQTVVVAHPEITETIELLAGALAALAIAGGSVGLITLSLGSLKTAITVLGGAEVAGSLAVLTSPVGLLGLALGIVALGQAMPSIPKWLIDMGAGAAMGAAAGTPVFGIGAVPGAIAGAAGGLSWAAGSALRDHYFPSAVAPSSAKREMYGPQAPVHPLQSYAPIHSFAHKSHGHPTPVVIVNPNDLAHGYLKLNRSKMRDQVASPTDYDWRLGLPQPSLPAVP